MMLPDIFDPKHTALLVVDKQAAYFDPILVEKRGRHLSGQAREALDNIDEIVSFMRSKDVPVVWTQMIEDRELSPSNIALKMQRDDYISISKPGDASFELVGSTTPTANEVLIIKKYYDAFSEPELVKYVRENAIKTLVIVGGYASRCVLATVVGANDNNLHVVIPKDCVANQVEAERELETFFGVVEAIFGYVSDAESIKKRIL